MMHARILAAFALAGVAGCGGGTTGTASTPATTSSHTLTKNTARIFIPARATAAGAKRTRLWVSPSTMSVSITATAADGYSGFMITAVPANSPNCTAVTGGRTCTLGFVAPPGVDTVAITAYDAPNAYAGNPVATATVPNVDVTAETNNNPLPFTLGGIVGKAIVLSPTTFHVPEGDATTYTLTIAGYDVDGNPISTYDAPLAVTQTDTDGTFTLSATSIANSATMPSITITYNGGTTPTTITVSTTSTNTADYYGLQETSITLTPMPT